MKPEQLEPYFSRWEKKWHDDGGKDINNPKIAGKFVRDAGVLVYVMPKEVVVGEAPLPAVLQFDGPGAGKR